MRNKLIVPRKGMLIKTRLVVKIRNKIHLQIQFLKLAIELVVKIVIVKSRQEEEPIYLPNRNRKLHASRAK